MSANDKIIVMGKLGAPFGIRGWCKLYSFTDPITNILDYPHWQLRYPKKKAWQAAEAGKTKVSPARRLVSPRLVAPHRVS